MPQGPEVTVGAFAWNGSTQSVGDGCPAGSGDTGGAVDLLAACVNSLAGPGAIFRQEYLHLYIDGTDYGPAAILLNTSGISVPISSSWFCSVCTPITDFCYRLALATGELTQVPYPGFTSPIPLECTQTTFCSGHDTIAGNTSPFAPSTPGNIAAHSGVILLVNN